MKTIGELIEPVKLALTSVSDNVGHFRADDTTRSYIYYMADGEAEGVPADNKKEVMALSGIIEGYFYPDDLPMADAVQNALEENEVCWELSQVQYEELTTFIHFSWDFEVI